jgi:hypothetical protein
VPFLRFTRDKRGYEQFALVHPTTNRRGKVRTRILYWYRTPPGVRVGREPFDDSMRRAIETQNPDIVFDWRKIVETPIPSAETEKWRERRRAEKAEKAARRAEAASESSTEESDEVDVPRPGDGSADKPESLESRGQAPQQDDSTLESETDDDADDGADVDAAEPELRVISELTVDAESPAEPDLRDNSPQTPGAPRRRRRRRRGRRSQDPAPTTTQPPAPSEPPESDDSREPE